MLARLISTRASGAGADFAAGAGREDLDCARHAWAHGVDRPKRKRVALENAVHRARVRIDSASCCGALVEMSQHMWPCVLVPFLRFLIGKAGVGQTQQGTVDAWSELNRDPSLRAFRRGRNPGEFDQPRPLEAKETTVMRMAPALKFCLKEKGRIDRWLHDHRTRGGKPQIELLGPRAEQPFSGGLHFALACERGRRLGPRVG